MTVKRTIMHFLRSKNVVLALVILILIVPAALIGVYFVSNPLYMNFSHLLEAPSRSFPFGTDSFGRDLLARICYGTRLSLFIGISVMFLTTLFGTFVGVAAGLFRKLSFLMRIMDALMSFPSLLLAIGLMAAFGFSITNIIIALTITYTPRMARVINATSLSLREETFVEAARAIGSNTARLVFFHILPNMVAVITVQATFTFAYAVLAEAGLSFIGIGVQPPDATLGNILGGARPIIREAPWIWLISGGLIFLLVFAVNMLGDGLRVLLDPKESREI